MSAFTTELHLRSLSVAEIKAAKADRQLYEVTQPFSYFSDLLKSVITVPAGFVTDFASIPRPVWNLLDPEDPCICWPSVIHDYNYSTQHVTREQADAILREGMEVQGAGWFVRGAVYRSLRLFGGSHWKTPTE